VSNDGNNVDPLAESGNGEFKEDVALTPEWFQRRTQDPHLREPGIGLGLLDRMRTRPR